AGSVQSVNNVGTLRVHPDAADVIASGNAIVIAGHMLPSRALIVRAEEAGAVLLRRANQVDALSIGVHRDGHANAPCRKGVRFDFRPRFPFINGLEQLSVTRPSRALTRASAAAAGGSARLSLSRSKNHIR